MGSFYIEYENQPCHIVMDKVDNPVHSNMYYLRFENGYENMFFTDIETGEWIEQDLGYTLLASAFGKLVDNHKHVEGETIKKRITWFSETPQFRIMFGYSKKIYGETQVYDIFGSNRRYMFTLIRDTEHWQVLNNYTAHSWNFSLKYFQDIPFLLEINEL